jgi:hypothetical protein
VQETGWQDSMIREVLRVISHVIAACNYCTPWGWKGFMKLNLGCRESGSHITTVILVAAILVAGCHPGGWPPSWWMAAILAASCQPGGSPPSWWLPALLVARRRLGGSPPSWWLAAILVARRRTGYWEG